MLFAYTTTDASPFQFEMRYKETERAREIYERYVLCLPSVRAWVKYAKFEYAAGEIALARRCYERALEDLAEEDTSMELYIKFAEFEQIVKEPERARAIFKCVCKGCAQQWPVPDMTSAQ